MLGTDKQTGAPLSGLEHLRQSITDILTTPLGSRVFRRTYGSRLYALLDGPITGATLVDFYQATAEALIAWEPRIQVTKVAVTAASAGSVSIDLTGTYLPDGQPVTIPGIIVD